MRVNGSTKQWYGSACKQKVINLLQYPPGHQCLCPEAFHLSKFFSYFHSHMGASFLWIEKGAFCHKPGAIRQWTSAETHDMMVQVFCRLSQLWKSSNHPVAWVFKLSWFFGQEANLWLCDGRIKLIQSGGHGRRFKRVRGGLRNPHAFWRST